MANPVLAQSDGYRLAYIIDFPSCCGDIVYNFYNPNSIVRGQQIFHATLVRPSCCGDIELPIQDKSGINVMTPTISVGCCVTWKVKNGPGDVVGYVKDPTCAQACKLRCLPCVENIMLRATDEKDTQRFTLRSPGCCDELSKICSQCETRCPALSCLNVCNCSTDFNFYLPVYSGDEKNKDSVARIDFSGKIDCCTKKVLQGYKCQITFPQGCTYNDTCLLVLLAMFADEALMGPIRSHKKMEPK